jgi:hypothetical protein
MGANVMIFVVWVDRALLASIVFSAHLGGSPVINKEAMKQAVK